MRKVEIEDVKQILRTHHYSVEDFQINEKDVNQCGDISHLKGEVLVKRKSNGKIRTYSFAKETEWFANFRKDLEQGFFN